MAHEEPSSLHFSIPSNPRCTGPDEIAVALCQPSLADRVNRVLANGGVARSVKELLAPLQNQSTDLANVVRIPEDLLRILQEGTVSFSGHKGPIRLSSSPNEVPLPRAREFLKALRKLFLQITEAIHTQEAQQLFPPEWKNLETQERPLVEWLQILTQNSEEGLAKLLTGLSSEERKRYLDGFFSVLQYLDPQETRENIMYRHVRHIHSNDAKKQVKYWGSLHKETATDQQKAFIRLCQSKCKDAKLPPNAMSLESDTSVDVQLGDDAHEWCRTYDASVLTRYLANQCTDEERGRYLTKLRDAGNVTNQALTEAKVTNNHTLAKLWKGSKLIPVKLFKIVRFLYQEALK